MKFLIKSEEGLTFLFLTNNEETKIYRQSELTELTIDQEMDLKYFFDEVEDYLKDEKQT